MKNNVKQDKGVTMVALVITVIILLIITNILIYNSNDTIHIEALTNLYNDIELLRDKVSEYYEEYGDIPAEIKYTNISQLENSKILSQNNDTGDFYVIDLEAMQGITLNYGKDYEKIKNDLSNVNNYTDVYIINENSHNIFYAQGIGIIQNDVTKIYHTDYTEPDETTVDLRYIDGILVPEGYYYIGKYKDYSGNESIVISKNKNEKIDLSKETQYLWKNQKSIISSVPNSVKIASEQNEDEFVKSVNHYKGYFINETTNAVVYLTVKENQWSEEYSENGKYTDKNGDIAYIPKGFRVSLAEGTNEIRSGLVITDSIDSEGNSTGNEFVWIPVNDFDLFIREDFSSTNKIDADDFTSEKLTEGKYYELSGDGKTVDEKADTSIQEVQNMYKSVKTYRGFYIGRYETGIEGSTARTSESTTQEIPVIKKNKLLYNYIAWGKSMTDESEGAVEQARSMYDNSTLCYGVQWDAIMRWINKDQSINYVLEDSSDNGNYHISGNLIRTGTYEEYQIKNIYDLAGNVSEWTMENYDMTQKVQRGGESGSSENITNRKSNVVTYKSGLCGFRVALYI